MPAALGPGGSGVDGQQNSISAYPESVHKGQKTFRTSYQGAVVPRPVYLEQTGSLGIDFLRFCSKQLR